MPYCAYVFHDINKRKMKRRQFLNQTAIGAIGLSLPISFNFTTEDEELAFSLLKEWCDGMMRMQMNTPNDATTHGALDCPACKEEANYKIHGRCLDAVYSLLYMADRTGDQRYLKAGIKVFEWGENVTMPDGSWTVVQNPKSWRGITIFGVIALAETLHYHGHLLDKKRKAQWMDRLQRAANYCYENIDINFSNTNYSFTAVYGFWVLGYVLENENYVAKSRLMASQVYDFFTSNDLVFGEGKPRSRKSGKSLPPVDLGYNVEESLGGLVQYALEAKDEKLLSLLDKSLMSHLQFMLPDGGWDNSWGTRQFKWTYWGSRTSDGCQVAYNLMAYRNPVFGLAARRNTELLQRCTKGGLLHGGPGYIHASVNPCTHHTFPHAKALTTILNTKHPIATYGDDIQLPRSAAYGVKYFEELDVYLIAIGALRATISGYDFIYKEGVLHATGGSLSLLYHEQFGLLAAGSMAKYKQVEAYNQQKNPNPDYPLTPRIETKVNGVWYTNLYDLKAEVKANTSEEEVKCEAMVHLCNEQFEQLTEQAANFKIGYTFKDESLQISVTPMDELPLKKDTYFVLPIILDSPDEAVKKSKKKVILSKTKGDIIIKSNRKIERDIAPNSTVFNVVPGVSAIPYKVRLKKSGATTITIIAHTKND